MPSNLIKIFSLGQNISMCMNVDVNGAEGMGQTLSMT